MQGIGITTASLSVFGRKLRGGSQPILAEASDGFHYVVKFRNNPQGRSVLFNESMGTELYRACGLAVPKWRPLILEDSFLDQNPGSWIETHDGRLRPEPGICYGSRFLGTDDAGVLEILPGSAFTRVLNRNSFWLAWLIDVCASHTDNRQAIFIEEPTRALNAVFIDHGHMFGGSKDEPIRSVQSSRYLDKRMYPRIGWRELHPLVEVVWSLNVDLLWARAQHLPDELREASDLHRFAKCLDKMSSRSILRESIQQILDGALQAKILECMIDTEARKPPRKVLSPDMGSRKAGYRQVSFPVCA